MTKPTIITEQTRIQLPLYILMPSILGIVSIVGLFMSIKQDTKEMRAHLESDWTARHMRIWVSEFKYYNTNYTALPTVDSVMEEGKQ